MVTLAELPSNSGNELLQLNFIERRDRGPDPGVDCRVLVIGSNWSEPGGPTPVHVDLGAVHLSLAAISSATSELARWVSLPLEQLAHEPLECEHQLALPYNALRLRFGARADIISNRKPVLTAAFSIGSFFTGELCFVTDQSCIAKFVAGLQAAQRAAG